MIEINSFKPIGDFILTKPVSVPENKMDGIIIPTSSDAVQKERVIVKFPKVEKESKFAERFEQLKEGDVIFLTQMALIQEISIDGEKYELVHINDVTSVVLK